MLKQLAVLIGVTSAILTETGNSKANPGPFVNETWYSGTVVVNNHDPTDDGFMAKPDDLFYWWFESRGDPKNDPIVLWLTGGPGCASEIALFYENGPYKFDISDNKTLLTNEYSWNKNANLIYVDQPIGTGFSHAKVFDLNRNEELVAANMAEFMVGFLEKYPQL